MTQILRDTQQERHIQREAFNISNVFCDIPSRLVANVLNDMWMPLLPPLCDVWEVMRAFSSSRRQAGYAGCLRRHIEAFTPRDDAKRDAYIGVMLSEDHRWVAFFRTHVALQAQNA